MHKNINVLCCHQSGEMYGSDKVFITAVLAIKQLGFNVMVLLASDGPLRMEFNKKNIEVIISPLGKIKRKDLTLIGLLMLPISIISGIWKINKLIGRYDVSLVYVNTIVILAPVIWAALKRKPLIWHVHEILDRPHWLKKIYSFLMNHFASKIIFVSNATAINYQIDFPKLKKKSKVVYNCYIESENNINLTSNESDLRMMNEIREMTGSKIGLVGRIHWLKGHMVLLDAVNLLPESIREGISIVFVGEPPKGGEAYAENLNKRISTSLFRERIKIYSYTKNIDMVYKSIDILVVPSIEAESFGLVAVEGMAFGCPVIASDIGGLREIISDGVDGVLVTPESPEALARAISVLVQNNLLRESLACAGKKKVHEKFGQERFQTEIQEIMREFHL